MADVKVPALLHKMSKAAQKAWYKKNNMKMPSETDDGGKSAAAAKKVKVEPRKKVAAKPETIRALNAARQKGYYEKGGRSPVGAAGPGGQGAMVGVDQGSAKQIIKGIKAGVNPKVALVRYTNEEVVEEATKKEAEALLGGPVKAKPKMPPGKQPAGYRYVRGLARKAMKKGMGTLPEASSPAQQAAIAIAMKKAGKKPKNEEVEQVDEANMRFDYEAAARPKSSDVKNFLNRDKNPRAAAASKKYIRRMTKLGGLGPNQTKKDTEAHMKAHFEEVEQVDEKAPPGAKFERMVKHIKKGYAKGGLTKQEKGIAYATAWKAYGKKNEEVESVNEDQASDMQKIQSMDKGSMVGGKTELKTHLKYLNAMHTHQKKYGLDTAKTKKKIGDVSRSLVQMGEEVELKEGKIAKALAVGAMSLASMGAKAHTDTTKSVAQLAAERPALAQRLKDIGATGQVPASDKRAAELQRKQDQEMPASERRAKELKKEEVEQVEEKYMGFKAVMASAKKGGARDPAAVAAAIGRKKYGKEKFQAAAAAGKKLGEGMDPVGREDKDIDNDGDSDKTDVYLHSKRKAIGNAIRKKLAQKMEKKDGE